MLIYTYGQLTAKWPFSYITYMSLVKMDYWPKCKTKILKLLDKTKIVKDV